MSDFVFVCYQGGIKYSAPTYSIPKPQRGMTVITLCTVLLLHAHRIARTRLCTAAALTSAIVVTATAVALRQPSVTITVLWDLGAAIALAAWALNERH